MTTTTKTKPAAAMSFTINRDDFLVALSNVSRVATTRQGQLPALSGVRLEVKKDLLLLACTDFDTTIEVDLALENAAPGVVILPAKLLVDVVRACPVGQIHVTLTGDSVVVHGSMIQFNLRAIPGDFPKLPERDGEGAVLDVTDIRYALERVLPAASSDDSRPILTGVLFRPTGDGFDLVATDSFRLALSQYEHPIDIITDEVIIPASALRDVLRFMRDDSHVSVQLRDHFVTFVVDDTAITIRLLDGTYVDYTNFLPNQIENKLVVNRVMLLAALSRAQLLTSQFTPVRLEMTSDDLHVRAVDDTLGESKEPVPSFEYDGEPCTLAFNQKFLIDGLFALTEDNVTIGFNAVNSPCVIQGKQYRYIIVPVTLQ